MPRQTDTPFEQRTGPSRLGDSPMTDGPVRARAHAPKGPLKAKRGKRDPVQVRDPMEARCTATNRQGRRCGKPGIPGGTVCRLHGGAAPQVRDAAMARLRKLQYPAIDRLEQLMRQTEFPSTAYQAVKDVLDRTAGKAHESVAVEIAGDLTVDVRIRQARTVVQQRLASLMGRA